MLVEILPCTSLYQPWRSRKSQRSILCFCETCETYECGVANLDIVLWTLLNIIWKQVSDHTEKGTKFVPHCNILQFYSESILTSFDIVWPFVCNIVQHYATFCNVVQLWVGASLPCYSRRPLPRGMKPRLGILGPGTRHQRDQRDQRMWACRLLVDYL